MNEGNRAVDMSLAASDAQHIIRENQLIQKFVGGQIVCRRILRLLDQAIEMQLSQEYDLVHPEMVLEYLQSAAVQRAVTTESTVAEARDELLGVLLPLVDVFVKMEEDNVEEEQTVLGSDSGSQN